MNLILKRWRWLVLIAIALTTRLYLLHIFDVELSQDGFEAVRTLTIWQTQGIAALPRELVNRALLHPLYMVVLGVWRLLIAVLFALWQARYRLAACLALLATLVRYEGVVLIALTFALLFIRDVL